MINKRLTLEELMKRFFPDQYAHIAHTLGQLTAGLISKAHFVNYAEAIAHLRESIEWLQQDCERLGLESAKAGAERLITVLAGPSPYDEQVIDVSKYLRQALEDGMRGRVFVALEQDKVPLAFEPHRFGEEVDVAFPSAEWDISEAARCIAFDRGTACVFHLMRVLEVTLRALSKTLNDPNLDPSRNPSWEAILRKCRGELTKPLRERTPEWRTDDQFFSEATARLMAVKDAWRNPTMHIGGKYTEEEAREIWDHVRSLTRHLATKLAEENATL